MLSLRGRYLLFSSVFLFFLGVTFLHLHSSRGLLSFQDNLPVTESSPTETQPPEAAPTPAKPKYKLPPPYTFPPIVDNFPLAAAAHSSAELPPIPSWNQPPSPHVPEKTPLLIGFTRNWRLLQQVVVSYITAGWPPEDIWVVENTGVMDSNERGLLSLQNPLFLNHTRLDMFGVNVIRTPTLLTFAQLQNFFLSVAIDKKWEAYFWGHSTFVSKPDQTLRSWLMTT